MTQVELNRKTGGRDDVWTVTLVYDEGHRDWYIMDLADVGEGRPPYIMDAAAVSIDQMKTVIAWVEAGGFRKAVDDAKKDSNSDKRGG